MLHNKLLWCNFKFKLKKESLVNKKLISIAINNFYTNEIPKGLETFLAEDKHIIVLFRIQTIDNQYKTIGTLQILNTDQKSKNYYIEYINNQIDFVLSGYSDFTIKAIFFSYGFRSGLAENSILQSKDFEPTVMQNFNHYKLP